MSWTSVPPVPMLSVWKPRQMPRTGKPGRAVEQRHGLRVLRTAEEMEDGRGLEIVAIRVADIRQEKRLLAEDRGRDVGPAEEDDAVGLFDDLIELGDAGIRLEQDRFADLGLDDVELEPVEAVIGDVLPALDEVARLPLVVDADDRQVRDVDDAVLAQGGQGPDVERLGIEDDQADVRVAGRGAVEPAVGVGSLTAEGSGGYGRRQDEGEDEGAMSSQGRPPGGPDSFQAIIFAGPPALQLTAENPARIPGGIMKDLPARPREFRRLMAGRGEPSTPWISSI